MSNNIQLNLTKYPTVSITRDDSGQKRMYDTPEGRVTSVTTIIQQTKSAKDKAALNRWKNMVGEDEAENVRDEAVRLGTLVHTHLENHIYGENDLELCRKRNFIHLLAERMANTVKTDIDKGITNVYGIEKPLYYKHLYSGTADLIADFNTELSVIDFKTSNKKRRKTYIKDYLIQLAAYAMAHDYMHGTDIRQGVIMMVTKDCEYQRFQVNGDEFQLLKSEWARRVKQYYGIRVERIEGMRLKLKVKGKGRF